MLPIAWIYTIVFVLSLVGVLVINNTRKHWLPLVVALLSFPFLGCLTFLVSAVMALLSGQWSPKLRVRNDQQSIAVVGCGPSAILAAKYLQDAGFRNITIYGRFEDAQLHTQDVEGVTADAKCCYMSNRYHNTIPPLMKQLGLRRRYLARPSLRKTLEAPSRSTSTPRIGEILDTITVVLHSAIFKLWGSRSPDLLKHFYAAPMATFLDQVGLGPLTRGFMFTAGTTAQLYGPLDTVTAYSTFKWLTPLNFFVVVANMFRRGTAVPEGGYERFFSRLLNSLTQDHSVRVRNCKVAAVTKAPPAVLLVSGETARHNAVFVCCPLTTVATPATDDLQGALVDPARHIQDTAVFTAVWSAASKADFQDRVYIEDVMGTAVTNTLLSVKKWGTSPITGREVYFGVGYWDRQAPASVLKDIVAGQAARMGLGCGYKLYYFDCLLHYNVQWTPAAVSEGVPLAVECAQGQGGIWYLGGGLSHWNVDSIGEHARHIVAEHVRRTDSSARTRWQAAWIQSKQHWLQSW